MSNKRKLSELVETRAKRPMYYTRAYFHFVERSVFTCELILEVIMQHIDAARDYRNFVLAIKKAGLISLRPVVRSAAIIKYTKHVSSAVVQLFNDIPKTVFYCLLPNGKYHGQYEIRTTQGNALLERRTYIEGKKVDCVETFYERDLYHFCPGKPPVLIAIRPGDHGALHKKEEYKNDKLHGTSITYALVSGKKIEQEDYVDGQLHGKHVEWDYTGVLRSTTEYYRGVRHGDDILYYTNGEWHCKTSWVRGKQHGITARYDNTQTITWMRTHNFGVLEGEAIDTDSLVKKRFWYAQNQLNGKYEKYWLPFGLKFYECWYRNDKQHGKEHFFDTAGKLVKTSNYSNGKLTGVQREWSGPRYRLTKEVHWRNGHKHGTEKTWNENGKLPETEHYVRGRKKVNKPKK
jgi:antitoxin component YwqK of YwqJK toxin-antitoxin module